MSTVGVEHVLVVPTSLFHELGYFQGFSTDSERYLKTLLRPENISYRLRDQMEQDTSFKQLIPYVIFRHTDELAKTDTARTRLFQYTRGKGQGEQRLHSKISVGIGGHISSDDHTDCGNETYAEGMRRELEEEVEIATSYRSQIAGLINDDETEVGKVHLGVVHIFDVHEPAIHPREDEIINAGFSSLADLRPQLSQMESWSRICVEALFG